MLEFGEKVVAPVGGPLDGKVIALNRIIHPHEKADVEKMLIKWIMDDLTARLGDCEGCDNAIVASRRSKLSGAYDDVIEGRAKCKTGKCTSYRYDGETLAAIRRKHDGMFRDEVLDARREMSMRAAISDMSSIPGAASILNDNRVSDHVVDAMKYTMTQLIDSSKDRPSSAAAGSW